jgi:hypothetical protein
LELLAGSGRVERAVYTLLHPLFARKIDPRLLQEVGDLLQLFNLVVIIKIAY